MPIPQTMKAMVLEQPGKALRLQEVLVPEPGARQVLVRVIACGVCRTDLHVVDQDLTEPKLPLVLGHEIVGAVVQAGKEVDELSEGDYVGIPWLGYTCGQCRYCRRGQENLCADALFTGYTLDGGFAEYTLADARYAFPLPKKYADVHGAPLLCAGLIGYRTYRMAGEHVKRLGIYGFGAAAHILAQIAFHEGKEVYAFTKEGDAESQEFARRLGAAWAGPSTQQPPEKLDAALIFAPVGELVPAALRAVVPGGIVVCGGIHMSDVPSFPYRLLWEERVLRSVANLTRQDGVELLEAADDADVHTQVETFPLAGANQALNRLREGHIQGGAVLEVSEA